MKQIFLYYLRKVSCYSRSYHTALSHSNCMNMYESYQKKITRRWTLESSFQSKLGALSQQSFSAISVWFSDILVSSTDHCSAAACKLLNNRIIICSMMNSLAQKHGWAFLQISMFDLFSSTVWIKGTEHQVSYYFTVISNYQDKVLTDAYDDSSSHNYGNANLMYSVYTI